jgi:hypothetical protein
MVRSLFSRSCVGLFLAIGVSACAPAVQHIQYRHDIPARQLGCPLDIYGRDQVIERANEQIGEVWIHDSGFSVDCGQEVVRGLMRDKACKNGADAVAVLKESFPNFWTSTCYRVKAHFLRYTDEDPRTGAD